jgi:predicted DsbA family dithiol-disulfide isomerase
LNNCNNDNYTEQFTSDQLHSILFDALYEYGINIGLVDELLTLAQQHGISTTNTEALEFCNYLLVHNNDGLRTAKEEIDQGRKNNKIKTVPFFTFSSATTVFSNNSFQSNNDTNNTQHSTLSGPQKSDAFLQAFRTIRDTVMNDY